MDDPVFEARLSRWFAEAPPMADSDLFARRVETRIDRAWAMRRLMIGAAGLIGGVFAAGQVLGARMIDQVAGASGASVSAARNAWKAVGDVQLFSMLPASGEVMWMAAGLLAVAVVLAATRALEEF